jgi:hypothetical protein
MPRSRSTSSLSRICCLPPGGIVPVSSSSRSDSVDLPWSTWATMQKLRNREIGIAAIRRSSSDWTLDELAAVRDAVVAKERAAQTAWLIRSGNWRADLLRALCSVWQHRCIGCSTCPFVALLFMHALSKEELEIDAKTPSPLATSCVNTTPLVQLHRQRHHSELLRNTRSRKLAPIATRVTENPTWSD